MSTRRRKSGFGQAADLPPDQFGIPLSRARRLRLTQAWRSVAGAAIARRAPALEIRRGVLEIARPDPQWIETLIPLLPRIAARLAATYPGLGVRRFRFREPGQPACASEPIPEGDPQDAVPLPPVPAASKAGVSSDPPALQAVREQYLRSVEQRSRRQKP